LSSEVVEFGVTASERTAAGHAFGIVPAFVVQWLVFSVGVLPLAFVVGALDVGYPWVVGEVALGLTAVAVDRGLAFSGTAAFSLVALTGFFVAQATAGGVLGDVPTAWTVGSALVAYAVAVLAVRVRLFERVWAHVDANARRERD
jgi:hypothetical protein